MIKVVMLVSLLIIGTSMEAQNKVDGSIKPTKIIAQSTLYLYDNVITKEGVNQVGQIMGSAFIVEYPLNDNTNRWVPLLVTARHVIANKKYFWVRFNSKVGTEPIYIICDVYKAKSEGDFWEHPEGKNVDMVVFRTAYFEEVAYMNIPFNFIASKDDFITNEIGEGDRIIIPALVQNMPGISGNYPIIRDGSIALVSKEPIEITINYNDGAINVKQVLILVNCLINEGFSGAPVVLFPGPRLTTKGTDFSGKPFLLGIVHGYLNKKEQIIDQEGNPVTLIKQKEGIAGILEPAKTLQILTIANSGIGIIFPSWRLLEILNSEKLKERIKEITK